MTTKAQSTTEIEAPERVKLWICCHCQTPRMVGLTVCERCHKRLHDVVEYARISPASTAPVVDESGAIQFNILTPEQKQAESVGQLAYWTWRKLSNLNFANISGEIEAAINHGLTVFGKDAFTAYNQAVEDAKAAIRDAPSYHEEDDYCAASFINAIARKCSPHVYVNRLAAATAAPEPEYVVINGNQRRVVPCPDGKPDCEVLHTEPVAGPVEQSDER